MDEGGGSDGVHAVMSGRVGLSYSMRNGCGLYFIDVRDEYLLSYCLVFQQLIYTICLISCIITPITSCNTSFQWFESCI